MNYFIGFAISVVGCVTVAIVAIALGGPGNPAPLKRINEPFEDVDYSDLPSATQFKARDGASLAYRSYAPSDGDSNGDSKGSVVLLHGSSASSRSMHAMAGAFATAGYTAYALDVRSHGQSAGDGDIDHIGQLEDDLEDFTQAVELTQPTTLIGFSSGGGFALRFAGSKYQQSFENYLLLSPFISQDAPTYRADSGGWISLGLPRIIVIGMLNQLGISALNHLPVVRYAVDDEAHKFLTPAYSYALAQNYRPKPDYKKTIGSVTQPMRVIAGRDDKVFHSDRFDAVFNKADPDIPVTLVPDVGHIGLILEPSAIQTTIKAVGQLDSRLNRTTAGPVATP